MLPLSNPPPPAPSAPQSVRLRWLLTIFGWTVALALVLYFFHAVALLVEGLLAASCLAAAMRPVADRLPGPRVLNLPEREALRAKLQRKFH